MTLTNNTALGYGERYYFLDDGTIQKLTILKNKFKFETIEQGLDYTDDLCMVTIVSL